MFQRRYAWQMQEELDLEAMKEAADCLTGKHDFAGFCTKASKKKIHRPSDIRDPSGRRGRPDLDLVLWGTGFCTIWCGS